MGPARRCYGNEAQVRRHVTQGGGVAILEDSEEGFQARRRLTNQSARQAPPPERRCVLALGLTGKETGASLQPLLELRPNPVAMRVELWGDNQDFQNC